MPGALRRCRVWVGVRRDRSSTPLPRADYAPSVPKYSSMTFGSFNSS